VGATPVMVMVMVMMVGSSIDGWAWANDPRSNDEWVLEVVVVSTVGGCKCWTNRPVVWHGPFDECFDE
tara:strand:- start:148 stop:351 length:204 start_codon:yes stop_codon:yes gene_type:complete